MKDKEKQIQEMAFQQGLISVIQSIFEILDWSGDTKIFEKGVKEVCNKYSLYSMDFEDSVVLSREEYESDLTSQYDTGYEFGSKETAEKILDNVFSYMGKNQNFILVDGEPQTWLDCLKIWEFMLELAKQFGVEIKE